MNNAPELTAEDLAEIGRSCALVGEIVEKRALGLCDSASGTDDEDLRAAAEDAHDQLGRLLRSTRREESSK